MNTNPLQGLRLPPLSKRGVAVLSVLSTATAFMAVNAFFGPKNAPTPPQIIVVQVPTTPAVLRVDTPASCPVYPGLTP